MIKISIQEMARKRGIETAYQLQKALDAHPSEAALLWKEGFSRIGLSTLDRLCRVLKCQPDKLLRYVPDEETTDQK